MTTAAIYSRTSSAQAYAWGVLMSLASPGFVLGAFCACGFVPRSITAMQHFVASRLRSRDAKACLGDEQSTWMNLGFWPEGARSPQHYDRSCQQLALEVVAESGMQKHDKVLCVGCGYGDELRLFSRTYGLKRVVGLDANPKASAQFDAKHEGIELVHGNACDVVRGRRLFREGEFDHIVAVDNLYHYDKTGFFQDCCRLLPVGGVVSVSDVVIRPGTPWWVRKVLSCTGIPACNHWTDAEYRERLAAAGLQLKSSKSLEPFVLAMWLPRVLCQYLDYVVVTATVESKPSRPKAAVIGSGMSGLVTAHYLSDTHDVTIFESRAEAGLAGLEARLPNGSVIDIPLRMIEPHYWGSLVTLCKDLRVPLVNSYYTTCVYSDKEALVKSDDQHWHISQHPSALMGRLRAALRLLWNYKALEGETLAEWLHRHNLVDSDYYQVYARRHLSWVLSCPYQMVDEYPASLVLDFCRGIQGSYWKNSGRTLRIFPSVKKLQDELLVGKVLRTGRPVAPFAPGDRTIDGVAYDAVVIATEASAVAKILPRPWTGFFDHFKYHPSEIFVHSDPSLMPPNREDWRAINVCDNDEALACQISVWVNAYYGPDVDLGGDVFETVNARHRPELHHIIKETFMHRVVHSTDTGRLQSELAESQGREGFYFCGAYSVRGMGLLEQAVASARWAADAVVRDSIRGTSKA
uniref:Methyltransferase type 11 domain-containing protein n=1 Tax=Noctiluca scintillans TaxID=2966 RepID=A0A7S1AS70_NOCSC